MTSLKTRAQSGMALLLSLVFLSLLTLIGVAAMQNATLQEKLAASLAARNQSFQGAEAALRIGESAVQRSSYLLPECAGGIRCGPPAESSVVTSAGFNATSGVTWIAAANGVYGVQSLGSITGAVRVPVDTRVTLYRVSAVGLGSHSRTVVESIYAKIESEAAAIGGKMLGTCLAGETLGDGRSCAVENSDGGSRRIMWRQIQ